MSIAIFSLDVAQDLLKNGFVVIDIAPNVKFKGKLVFYFPKSDDLLDYLRENHKLNFK